jgi:hypothetical protein
MAKRKYEHLIKPLSVGRVKRDAGKGKTAPGPGNAGQMVRLNGKDHLEGLNLNFTWGLHNKTGEWYSGQDLHVHPYPECLVFAGLDTANVNYLGAEIEVCLGEEQETYSFNEPTLVVIPAGLPHGPTVTRRIFSPKGFGFYLAGLNAATETTWLKKSAAPAKSTGKYAHLLKPLRSGLLTKWGKPDASRFTPAEAAEFAGKSGEKPGPGNADHLTRFYGKDLEGLDVNLAWGFYSQPGIWRRGAGAHVHPADEIMVFIGTDPANIDYLGAEIEIDMGKEHERYLFDKPTVVICPSGLPHNPVVVRWVDRPYALCAIGLSGEPETRPFA